MWNRNFFCGIIFLALLVSFEQTELSKLRGDIKRLEETLITLQNLFLELNISHNFSNPPSCCTTCTNLSESIENRTFSITPPKAEEIRDLEIPPSLNNSVTPDPAPSDIVYVTYNNSEPEPAVTQPSTLIHSQNESVKESESVQSTAISDPLDLEPVTRNLTLGLLPTPTEASTKDNLTSGDQTQYFGEQKVTSTTLPIRSSNPRKLKEESKHKPNCWDPVDNCTDNKERLSHSDIDRPIMVENNISYTISYNQMFVSGLTEEQMRCATGHDGLNVRRFKRNFGVSIEVYEDEGKLLIKGGDANKRKAVYDDLIKNNIPLVYEIPSLKFINDELLGLSFEDAREICKKEHVELLPMKNKDGSLEKVVMEGSLRNVHRALKELWREEQTNI